MWKLTGSATISFSGDWRQWSLLHLRWASVNGKSRLFKDGIYECFQILFASLWYHYPIRNVEKHMWENGVESYPCNFLRAIVKPRVFPHALRISVFRKKIQEYILKKELICGLCLIILKKFQTDKKSVKCSLAIRYYQFPSGLVDQLLC